MNVLAEKLESMQEQQLEKALEAILENVKAKGLLKKSLAAEQSGRLFEKIRTLNALSKSVNRMGFFRPEPPPTSSMKSLQGHMANTYSNTPSLEVSGPLRRSSPNDVVGHTGRSSREVTIPDLAEKRVRRSIRPKLTDRWVPVGDDEAYIDFLQQRVEISLKKLQKSSDQYATLLEPKVATKIANLSNILKRDFYDHLKTEGEELRGKYVNYWTETVDRMFVMKAPGGAIKRNSPPEVVAADAISRAIGGSKKKNATVQYLDTNIMSTKAGGPSVEDAAAAGDPGPNVAFDKGGGAQTKSATNSVQALPERYQMYEVIDVTGDDVQRNDEAPKPVAGTVEFL